MFFGILGAAGCPIVGCQLENGVLEYHSENTSVVLLPIWSFMWQFEYFAGKGIFQESLFPFEQATGGDVFIWVT